MSTAQYQVSIIIPVYNEAGNVAGLFQEIVDAVDSAQYEYEVIFVDDGSTDGTSQILKNLAKQDARARAICHQGNFGQSAATLTGALQARYPWLVTMDGDGQNDPRDIAALFQALQQSNTVVLGRRKKRDDNPLRKLSSRVGNGVRRFILDDGCKDTGCSLKLFPRDAFLRLPHFNHMHRFLPALFKRAQFNLVHIDVNHRPRVHGVSKYGVMNRLFVGIYDLIGMRWLLNRPCLPEVSHEE